MTAPAPRRIEEPRGSRSAVGEAELPPRRPKASPPNAGSAATSRAEALQVRAAVRETVRREGLVHARCRGAAHKRRKPKPGGLGF